VDWQLSPLPSILLWNFSLLTWQLPAAQRLYQHHGCWWNERSLNRGLNRCRGLGLGGPFFSNSCSKLEIDEAFQISHKLGLGLAEKFSKAFAIQLDRYPGQYTPRPSAHPPKNPDLVCFPGFHALLAAHVHMLFDISHILRVGDYFSVLLPVGYRGVVRILWILNLKGIKNLIIIFICKHKCFYV
jgi:hypothetical protein